MKLRRIAAIFAAAILTLLCVCVPVGALSFEKDAHELKSDTAIKVTFDKGDTKYYKATLTDKGEFKFKISMEAGGRDSNGVTGYVGFKAYLYNSEGKEIKSYSNSDYELTKTGLTILDKSVELKKGTYYLGITRDKYAKGTGETKITVSFPSDTKAAKSGKSASTDYPAIYLAKGDTVRLGAIVSGKAAASVSLSSSKADVAKIDSDGYVTAKAKGTSVVTIKSGSSTVKVAVIIE